jgi:hypothetical protein
MYNNEVTYDKKWETQDNKKAYKKLDKKFFDRSICYPSCPEAWAPEVLELLNLFDKELGVARNESTIRSYYIQGNPLQWFVTDPFKNLYKSLISLFLEPLPSYRKQPYTVAEKLQKIVSSFTHSIAYGFRASKVLYVNPILNKIFRPKFRLDQVKEKYGQLNIYYSVPEAFEEWVENEINKTIVKLAIKGAYYPLETLYGYRVGNYVETEYNPDTIEVERKIGSDGQENVLVYKTTMRKIMKDMGVNMEDVKLRYLERKEKLKGMP